MMSDTLHNYMLKYKIILISLILFLIFTLPPINALRLDIFLQYLFASVFAIVFTFIVILSFIIYTLNNILKYITFIIKNSYDIKKLKIFENRILMEVYKNNIYFCSIYTEYLNTEFPTIIVPLNTPLSFFNASSRRIVGDGNEIIRTKLPKAIWDIHTEFDTDKNYLIVKIDAELLKEKDDILPIIEEIKEKIEKMEYSDEHLKKLPDEMVATNEFMKGHMCTKCGNLIPKSKINEKCPVDGDPHKTTMLMLDIHVPYSPLRKISLIFLVLLILIISIEIGFFKYYFSNIELIIFITLNIIIFTFFIKYYFQNILNFKNMLRHFEAKKEYILKNLGKEEGNNLTSKVEAPKERKP